MSTNRRKAYDVLGIMSGTSLDGLDMAACRFYKGGEEWSYKIEDAMTVPYNREWRKRLESAFFGDAHMLVQLHAEFGKLIGQQANVFMQSNGFKPQLIASHGHTVFHDPGKGITHQIGSGAEIAAATGISVVCDFRTTDVALGGQGAPLVPVGDTFLFRQYQACLNLGGFSNISFDRNGRRIAFDICPVNIVMNDLAKQLGHHFDKDGLLASQGNVVHSLLESLNALEYYYQPPPKSLGREWVISQFIPLLESEVCSPHDKLRTMIEHIAGQIGQVLQHNHLQAVMITGGGAHNLFLLERIKLQSQATIIMPDISTIDYKEALIFAFLGLLRSLGMINCFSTVTGAKRYCSSGAVYLPPCNVAE
ncbi:MAG: anhydro-N-acetylmuramic acid kinase [Bacteroidales bacterium]|nr:anhydro-N-acetylmuramic acid kinase [Bacteroidales bacterium]MDZ4203914.1 anhydro-N-acetylmuramic acid kinase [Bacteroidales bacterium]